MKTEKYIGIIGSRRRNSESDFRATVDTFMNIYHEGCILVSGGCSRGGDRFAEDMAKSGGLPILIFYPDWEEHKKYAGFVRNTYIAEKADILIACVALDRKGGTEDTIKKFLKKIKMSEARAIDEKLLILV